MKIRAVGAGLFRADGWTDGQMDTTKLIVAFRNFFRQRERHWSMQFVCQLWDEIYVR